MSHALLFRFSVFQVLHCRSSRCTQDDKMLNSKTLLIFYFSSYFCGISASLSIQPGQSVSFECNIDYGAILDPILEVTNQTLNLQSSFSEELQAQNQTINQLKTNIETLPNVLSQIVDPINQASNQGIL